MSLGENIRKKRKELKLSQEYVAEKLGVSRQAVSKWETEQSEPTAGNLVELANVFGIGLSELVEPKKYTSKKTTEKRKQNLILRANLTRTAITMQAAFLIAVTQALYMFWHADHRNKGLYKGEFFFDLVLLLLASIWMSANHLYEADVAQRRKNIKIELIYCCVQAGIALFTIRFEMGLAGMVIIIAAAVFYLFYINSKFMNRKLTKSLRWR